MRDPRVAAHRPAAMRLWTQATRARPPEPPRGSRWDPAAPAIAVWLALTSPPPRPSAAALAELSAICAQLPDPEDIPPATPVVVLGSALWIARGWRRWLGAPRVAIPRALRGSALLMRGYVDLGASADEDLAWGWSPVS